MAMWALWQRRKRSDYRAKVLHPANSSRIQRGMLDVGEPSTGEICRGRAALLTSVMIDEEELERDHLEVATGFKSTKSCSILHREAMSRPSRCMLGIGNW